MNKVSVFFKRLQRFFVFLFKDVKRRVYDDCKWKRVMWDIIEPILALMVIALMTFVISTLILAITILAHSNLHFADDWTWTNVGGSWLVTMTVAIIGATFFIFGYIVFLKIYQVVSYAWTETSSRALAIKLWE